jgi:hypothetical protein
VQREAPYQVGLDRLEQHVVVKQGIEAVNRRLAGRERSPLLYRKYRCAGRVNKPGSCQLPMLSAEVLEQAVLEVVLADLQERSQEALLAEINAAVERRRAELEQAIELAEERLAELQRRAERLSRIRC